MIVVFVLGLVFLGYAVATRSTVAVFLAIVLIVWWLAYAGSVRGIHDGEGLGRTEFRSASLGPPLIYPDPGLYVPTPTTTTTRPTSDTPRKTFTGDVTGDLGVFKVTCYGPPHFPAGQVTASGAPVGPGSVAVDPAVIPLGTVLEIEGYGRGVANDRGSAVRGRHVDIWRADPYNDCAVRSARVRVVS